MPESIRPTKKQQELLQFIDSFIAERGYSPSYREIMRSLNYNSVATVALHVKNLIARGHLQKRGRSARSLEVVNPQVEAAAAPVKAAPAQEKWLIERVESCFVYAESQSAEDLPQYLDQLYVLVGALKILQLEAAAQAYIPRLNELKRSVQ